MYCDVTRSASVMGLQGIKYIVSEPNSADTRLTHEAFIARHSHLVDAAHSSRIKECLVLRWPSCQTAKVRVSISKYVRVSGLGEPSPAQSVQSFSRNASS